jgi:hypothetical protein
MTKTFLFNKYKKEKKKLLELEVCLMVYQLKQYIIEM